jgi:hypothetical protein
MNIALFRTIVSQLPAAGPRHKALESWLAKDHGPRKAWYSSQKEHLLGWLGEYDGPGAYGRKGAVQRDASFVYNHFQCSPGLIWLAEAVGLKDITIKLAVAEATAAGANGARQCAAVRRVIPWNEIEAKLWKIGPVQRPS